MSALPRWPDSLLARYEPLDVLQTGDPDYLYLAEDRDGERRVLVVLFRREQLEDAQLEALEAHREKLGDARHPRLLLPFEVCEEEDLLVLVHPAGDGRALHEIWEREPPMAPEQAMALARCLLEGLAYLHSRGLTHGCVDPERVFRHSSGWVLLDGSCERALGTGVTPEPWCSPGDRAGEPRTPAEDLYQVGLLLYRSLTGVRPFPGDVPPPAGARPAKSPADHRPFLPVSLSGWVLRLLEPDPEERPADAEAALAELDELRRAPDLSAGPAFARDPGPGEEEPTLDAGPERPEPLPPRIPSYEDSSGVRWWQIALLILAAEVGTVTAIRSFTASRQAATTPPTSVPDLRDLSDRLDQSADTIERANQSTAAESLPPSEGLPARPTPPTTAPAGPFPADYGARIEAELEAAAGWRLGMDGEVEREPEDGAGLEPFLDPDPLRGGRILQELEEVGRFRAWLEEGGEPETLPRHTRDQLRQADQAFRRQGLTRPFHPEAYLSPSRAQLSPAEAWRRTLGREPPEGDLPDWTGGWFAQAAKEAALAVSALREVEAQARRQGSDDPWVKVVHALPTREGRLELARLLEEGRMQWRRALYAGARSLAEEPETYELAALLLDELLARTRALGALDLLIHPPARWLGEAAGPGRALLEARLTRLERRVRERVDQEDPDALERERLLWRQAAERDSWDPLALRREQIATLEELAVLRESEDYLGAGELWHHLVPRLPAFDEEVQARVHEGLIEVMELTGSRLDLTPEDFETLSRRALYLAPLLGSNGRSDLAERLEKIRAF